MKKYDSIIVLSNKIIPGYQDTGIFSDGDRKLAQESIARVFAGLLLYGRVANILLMNGGPGKMTNGNFVPRGTHPVQCELMVDFAIQGGVPKENLISQDYSADTVGEAFFVKPILIEKNLKNNLIITSNYHVKRVNEIYKKMWGPNLTFEIRGVNFQFETGEEEKNQMNNEERSLEFFSKQFGDIADGDDQALEERLWEVHELYNKLPETERLLFYNSR